MQQFNNIKTDKDTAINDVDCRGFDMTGTVVALFTRTNTPPDSSLCQMYTKQFVLAIYVYLVYGGAT